MKARKTKVSQPMNPSNPNTRAPKTSAEANTFLNNPDTKDKTLTPKQVRAREKAIILASGLGISVADYNKQLTNMGLVMPDGTCVNPDFADPANFHDDEDIDEILSQIMGGNDPATNEDLDD